MLSHWWIAAIFLAGVVIVLSGLGRTLLKGKPSFYLTGLGVFLAVWGILLDIGFGEVDYYPGQVMYLCADISELTEDTGFVPEYSFEEGIKETVEWYRKEYLK